MTTSAPTRPPRSQDHRALRLELTLQRYLLWGCGALAAATLLLAAAQVTRLGVVPFLLAVAAPVAATPKDTAREDWLRGSLGIPRAAHVRARVRLVLLVQLALVLVAALVILVGPHGGDGATMLRSVRTGGITLQVPTPEYWQDLMVWVSAVLWSHLFVGRDALRSSSTWMWVRALISFLGMYVLSGAAMLGPMMLLIALATMPGLQALPAEGLALALAGVLLIGGGLVALRWRSRVWARTA